jgi:putative tricarboxylic transport membrane protein
MGEILQGLLGGFINCFHPVNLLMLIGGIVIGLIVGILPGLTLVMGVVLALPFTYSMDVTPAIVLLTAMYVAGTYGGAPTAILFKIPGEPIDIPMLWDGYTMARKGHAAKALGWTLLAALGGGLLSALVLAGLAQPVANIALQFSTPEYFAIVLFGLASVVSLGQGSMVNAVLSLCLGLLIATVGVDDIYGSVRFTFGVTLLQDGIEFLTVIVGAYGLGEVFTRLHQGFSSPPLKKIGDVRTQLPTFKEIKGMKATFLRSSIIGTLIGIIPGAGATIASFVSYGVEGQYGRRRREMGTGVAEGIVAPQAAATASVGGALIPLLTLGIPGSGATAIILGAFLLHGMQPGPQVFLSSAGIIYTVIASLFLGIIVMCLIGYFAIRPLVKVLDFPEPVVSAFIMVLCFIGALSIRNNAGDLWIMAAFGIIGYLLERYKFPIAPLVLGVILGPLAESAFMTSMLGYQGDWTIFFRRPISGTIMVLTIIAIIFPIISQVRGRRRLVE